MVSLICVRHGQSRANERKIFTGQTDVPLSALGEHISRVRHRDAVEHIPVLPRLLSLFVRWWTGIEIHPAAKIGAGFFVDHGAGVVIGETAEVGENVTLFHGVTLGATGNEKSHKRHPTLGDNIFVGSGAKLLGPITIGSNSKIGANSVVLRDVPEGATVTGVRARVVKLGGSPVRQQTAAEAYAAELEARLARLEEEIRELRAARAETPPYLSVQRFSAASRRRGTPRAGA